MTMTALEMDQKMDEHFAFEANDDVEGVLGTLAPNVRHDIVGSPGGPTQHRENARPFYEALFADLADSEVTTIRRLYGADFLIDESSWAGKAVGKPFGLEGNDRPLTFRMLHVIQFNPEHQLQSEQVWVDLAAILQQLPQG